MNLLLKRFISCVGVVLLFSQIYAEEIHDKLKIVASTTAIGSILQYIGGESVEVTVAVKGAMCPGHFDVDPGTVKKMASSSLIIHHNWEKWLDRFDNIVGKNKLRKVSVNIEGNWMIPEINVKAAEVITNILCEIDNQKSNYYKLNFKQYSIEIETLSKEIKDKLIRFKGYNVVCSSMQKDFIKWLGFNVVAEYGRAEDITVNDIANIIRVAKEKKAVLVIDNLQSGADTGKQFAKDLGVGHITLSNFPLDNKYKETLEENIDKIIRVLNEKHN
jgi:ABC-type Zn uptake system ZnuABC Zn-binding protein ZnuA